MKVFAISDLHLSINNSKPMDIFGPVWENYWEMIKEDWNKKVSDDDVDSFLQQTIYDPLLNH
jgi:predicted phosphohydrolase